jgi:hypothetical protein
MQIPIRGEVAIPAAESVGGEKVTCIVSEGEAIILRSSRCGMVEPSGVDVPVTVFVVLKEGTTQCDTKRVSLPFSYQVRFLLSEVRWVLSRRMIFAVEIQCLRLVVT